ncbi:MAG TPA: arginine--tRNA ligase [Clostridiales bacterium]|nr:arginine--tRNA ligase [Clostridiales bacterium]
MAGEKLATRKGNVVLLKDLISQSIDKTLEIMKEKNPDLPDMQKVAAQVGVGSVIFDDLYSNRIKDVDFNWEEALNFDGETGPYVQYTHARACSVISRSDGESTEGFDASLLSTREEAALIHTIQNFPARVLAAMAENEPSIIARHLVDVCQSFNKFYHLHSILSGSADIRKARLALVKASRITMRNALELIGLKTPERI